MAQRTTLINVQDDEGVVEEGDAVSVQVSVTTTPSRRRTVKKKKSMAATSDVHSLRPTHREEEIEKIEEQLQLAIAKQQKVAAELGETVVEREGNAKAQQAEAKYMEAAQATFNEKSWAKDTTMILDELAEMRKQLQVIVEAVAHPSAGFLKAPLSMVALPPGAEEKRRRSVQETETVQEDEYVQREPESESDIRPIISGRKSAFLEDRLSQNKAANFKNQIAQTILRAEDISAEEAELEARKQLGLSARLAAKYETLSREDVGTAFESMMGWLIAVNAIYIGIATDLENEEEPIWFWINLVFSVIFLMELSCKLLYLGPRGYFCGANRVANIFDMFLVLIDSAQLLLDLTNRSSTNMVSATLFRMFRLAKLTRLLRLLRSDAFKDLVAMIHGMIVGMSTLMWALVLFLLVVYVIALVFRELLGSTPAENISEEFNTVPRSIYTIFRCSFGECDSKEGYPIFQWVYDRYGILYVTIFCAFSFMMMLGLFNVVSAIFVQSTLDAATKLQMEKKRKRRSSIDIWSKNIGTLIQKVFEFMPECGVSGLLSNHIDFIYGMEVPVSVFDKVVKDEEARKALFDLDIEPDDNEHLSEILDPDNDGNIELVELLDGLRRLRGDPRRSDIVAINLMLRTVHDDVQEILEQVKHR